MNWYLSNRDPVDGACACQVSEQSRAQAHVGPFPCISLWEMGSLRLPSSWSRYYCCIHYSRTPGPRLSTTTVQKMVSISCFFCTLLVNVFITLTKFRHLSVCLEINFTSCICSPVLHSICVCTYKEKFTVTNCANCSCVQCKHKIHVKDDYQS